MDLRESIEQYQQQFDVDVRSGERSEQVVALDLLIEFLGDYAALQQLEALTLTDLEEFFVDWYLRQPGVSAEFAVTLLDAVRAWLGWTDEAYRMQHGEMFQPLYERLREDLPRILEAWTTLAERLRLAQEEEAIEAGLEDLTPAATTSLISSGLNRVVRPDEVDYSAAREDYFRIVSVDEASLMLQSPSGSELGEAPVGPVRVPEAVAELLRVGDLLYVEVAPGPAGWEILEIARALPGGYAAARTGV
jgi:hypothetical protein